MTIWPSLPTWRPRAFLRLMGELILGLFGVIIIFVAIVLPTIKTITYLHTTIYQEYQDLETRYRQGHNLRTLTKQMAEAKNSLSALEAMFYNPLNPLERIQWLENLAKETGLEGEIAVTLPKTNQPTMAIEMRLQGPWSGLRRFLGELDRAANYAVVNRLSVTAQNGETVTILLLELTPLPTSTITL